MRCHPKDKLEISHVVQTGTQQSCLAAKIGSATTYRGGGG